MISRILPVLESLSTVAVVSSLSPKLVASGQSLLAWNTGLSISTSSSTLVIFGWARFRQRRHTSNPIHLLHIHSTTSTQPCMTQTFHPNVPPCTRAIFPVLTSPLTAKWPGVFASSIAATSSYMVLDSTASSTITTPRVATGPRTRRENASLESRGLRTTRAPRRMLPSTTSIQSALSAW